MSKTSRLLAVVIVIGLVIGVFTLQAQRADRLDLTVLCELPPRPGCWVLLWADGPVCASTGWGLQYLRLSDSGKVTKRIMDESHAAAIPLSSWCAKRVVLSGYTMPDDALGLFCLDKGGFKWIASGRRAHWLVDPRYNFGRFWNADCTKFVAYNWQDRMNKKQLLLIDKAADKSAPWRVPYGHVISWHWRDSDLHPWVLTRSPGLLYRMFSTQPARHIPALDAAQAGMLSPTLDRAIGFMGWASGPFYVDFKRPKTRHPIVLSDGRTVSRARLGWGVWSPSGHAVALLVENGERQMELHVGDPAHKLRKVNCPAGFAFPSLAPAKVTLGTAYGMLPSTSVTWNQDGSVLYCILVRANPKSDALPECFVASVRV